MVSDRFNCDKNLRMITTTNMMPIPFMTPSSEILQYLSSNLQANPLCTIQIPSLPYSGISADSGIPLQIKYFTLRQQAVTYDHQNVLFSILAKFNSMTQTQMEYSFRTATIDDTAELKHLGINSYGQFIEILSAEHWEKLNRFLTSERTYIDLLAKSCCFVCERNRKIIGMAFLVPSGNPTDIFPADWCYLRMVGVHTDHGGQGIGKALTEMCISEGARLGEKTIGLHTSEFMDAARHLYESVGFRQVRELRAHLGKRYWLYKLDLPLVSVQKLSDFEQP